MKSDGMLGTAQHWALAVVNSGLTSVPCRPQALGQVPLPLGSLVKQRGFTHLYFFLPQTCFGDEKREFSQNHVQT